MISRRESAYSSMTRRASSERDSLGGGRSLLGRGSLVGVMDVMVGRDQKGTIELNQRNRPAPLRLSRSRRSIHALEPKGKKVPFDGRSRRPGSRANA